MLKCRQDLDALRQTARSAYNAQAEKIIVCAGTGCVAGGSLKVFDRLKELLEAQNIPVEVRLEGTSYTVLRWQAVSTADWAADETLDLWDGDPVTDLGE